MLKDEGVTHLFGNPGTTELPIMHALKEHPDLTYVMAMQESLVVAIADGFSRASGRLVACNVHVAPGLGNAMGALYNAKFTGTPIILTAGQQEQGHGLMEPMLYGPLVRIAEPLVKWAVEVTRLEDLPRILRRASKIINSTHRQEFGLLRNRPDASLLLRARWIAQTRRRFGPANKRRLLQWLPRNYGPRRNGLR